MALKVGADVLLARPTGESKQYEILGRIHEEPIQAGVVSSPVTPAEENPVVVEAFSADPVKAYVSDDIVLTAKFAHGTKRISKITIDSDNGDEPTEIEVTEPTPDVDIEYTVQYSETGEKNPTLTMTYGADDETETFELDNGPITIGEISISSFNADNTSPDVGESITVTAQFEDTFGDVDNYDINWGDGNTENFSNTPEVEE